MNPSQGVKKKKRSIVPVAEAENSARKTCDTLDNAEDTQLIILLNSTIIQQQWEADKC